MFHKTLLVGSILIGSFCYPIQGSLGSIAVKNSKGDVADGSETPLSFSMKSVLLKKRKIDKKLFVEKIKRKRKKKDRQKEARKHREYRHKQIIHSDSTYSTYTLTAYTTKCIGCTGISASGIDIRGVTNYQGYNIVAVDDTVLPLFSVIRIVFPDGKVINAIALDTGSAIKNNRLDLLVSSKSEAYQIGRQNVKVEVLRRGK